jgi:glycosyltransferase involved in cell wall biosynthesis
VPSSAPSPGSAADGGPPLSVLLVVPPWLPVPPVGYGGVEAVCALLAEGLAARGHRVEIMAAGGSRVGVPLHTTYPAPLPDRINDSIVDVYHATRTEEVLAAGDFDIVHDHTLMGPLLGMLRRTPTVTTVHNAYGRDYLEYAELVSRRADLVGVSRTLVESLSGVTWRGWVHNGIPTADFPYADVSEREDWVLYLGRAVRVKGIHTAIDAARAAGKRIVIAAKCHEPPELRYYEQYVAPRLGPDTEWLGEVDFKTKADLLVRASCLLNPIDWNEPFGLVMAEAQACGTPVVALDRGAVPEIVEDGVTGIVCDTVEELPAAVHRVGELSSERCRERAVSMFDQDVMAAGYERFYRETLA